jgi:hypothetical protein
MHPQQVVTRLRVKIRFYPWKIAKALQVMRTDEITDPTSADLAGVVVEGEMDAPVNAAHADLAGASVQAVIGPEHPRQGIGSNGERNGIGAEEPGQDPGGGMAERAVTAGVGGEGRGGDDGFPSGIFLGERVAIFFRTLDGGDGTPEVETVLGLPTDDGGVGHGDRDQGEEPRGFIEGKGTVTGNDGGDLQPVAGGVAVWLKSDQNTAVSVWYGVRRVLLTPPRTFTSLRASAYSRLSRGGGGGGLKDADPGMANGVTDLQWGSNGGRKNGPVRRHCPGSALGM